MNLGILGLGEVGSAIHTLIGDKYPTYVRELKYDHFAPHPIDILHVCIPYSSQFSRIVSQIIKTKSPQLTIIHSTVAPGTTAKIFHQTQANLVHSPFMGVHPHKPKDQFIHQTGCKLPSMTGYFSKFPKIIGPVNPHSAQLARQHLQQLGLRVLLFDSPLESELAKILSTTYYGWNIIFEKWVHQLCHSHNANFDQVYTEYNHMYNQGYKKDLPHVIRPVLQHHQGQIGGHCVIPNAEILNHWIVNDFTAFLLQQNHQLSPAPKRQPTPQPKKRSR